MTIGEHICSDKALTCGSVAIRVNKAVHCRVIIAALQIIEAGFGIAVIPAITQRVDACHASGLRENVAPRIVLIGSDLCATHINELHDVALEVQNVIIGLRSIVGALIRHCKRTPGLIIEEIDRFGSPALPDDLSVLRHKGICAGQTAPVDRDGFCLPNTVRVICIGRSQNRSECVRCAGFQLTAIRPRHGAAKIRRRIAACVVGDCLTVDLRQQIRPFGIPIAIRLSGCLAVLRAGFGKDIPGGVIGIGDGAGDVACGRALAVVISLLGELVLRVVLIGDEGIERFDALGDARDVAKGIIGILLALEHRAVGAADVAVLHLRGGAACVKVAEGIGRGVDGRAV